MEISLQADYNEVRAKQAKQAIAGEAVHPLVIDNLPIEVVVANVNQLSQDEYITVRRQSFGASDSSIVLGVNPFKTREELIEEKLRTEITAEERAVGEKTSVKKGRDLEPLIIQKFQKAFRQETFKPSDMYRFRDYPYLSVNFDGVTGTPEQYIPAEIKVVTMAGEKHYKPYKAMFDEFTGWHPLPEDVTKNNWSIENKAAHYGIPPYYYTQLQQQMLALNAPFGHLSILLDRTWVMYTFYVHRDDMMLNELILQGYKLWNIIEKAKASGITGLKTEKRETQIVDYMKREHVNWAMASNATPILSPNLTEKKVND